MAWLAGRADDARAHYGEAIGRFDSAGLAHPAARVSAALAEILWQEGKLEDAIADMERAFGVLAEEAPDADLAALASQLGRLLYFAGRLDDAAARIEYALGLAEALRLPDVFAQSLITKGIVLASLSRSQEGSALISHALEVALENGLSAAALRAYQNLSVSAYEQDRHADALELLAAKLELSRKTGNRVQELTTLAANVGELLWLGRWDEAVAAADELGALEGTSTTNVVLELVVVAVVHAERGDIGEARRVLATLSGGEESGDVQARSVYWSIEARLLRAEGRPQESLAAAERAFALRRELGLGRVREGLVEALEAAFDLRDKAKIEELLGVVEDMPPGDLSPWLTAQGARFAARLSVLRGATDSVSAGFTAAADAFRELSMPFWLAVAQLEHGEWLAEQGRPAEAEPLLEEADEIFSRLEARPWLKRCAQARTRQLEPA
jgi:tetratricopeptide (TPR) repeat protein